VFELIVKATISYLLGSIVGGLVVGRLRGGVDIRRLGSGNAGGTNALRTQGKSFAFWVMLIDIGKGWLAVQIVAHMVLLPVIPLAPSWVRVWIPMSCGIAAIVGHVYPLWYGFRGGKGVATLLGVVLGLDAWLMVPLLLTWILTVAVFGFVGLASMVATASLPVCSLLSGTDNDLPQLVFGLAATLLVAWTHRGNIARMRAGTEPRARRLWLFGPDER
jgi:acyl phosphate:glycerol-3-phosphate acyltransferase